MAAVWQPESLWTQHIRVCTRILPDAPGHLPVGTLLVASKAPRCSSLRSPALPVHRIGVGGNGLSSDGGCQEQEREQERLWEHFFLDPTMWWDNRRDKKSSCSPDFRRKGSGEVLWLDNVSKPAWVDEQLLSLDMQMGQGVALSECSSPGKPESGRHDRSGMGARCSSVTSPALPLPIKSVGTARFSNDDLREEHEHLWQHLFMEPTMWWDNRRDKKSSGSPDFRRKGSGEVLWLNNTFKPAWVDEKLVSLNVKMGHGGSPSKSRSRCKPQLSRREGSEMGVVTAGTVSMLCQQGKLCEALVALESLVETDSAISPSLFYSVLKLCREQKDMVVGRRVHKLTVKLGYNLKAYLGNHILRMYASGGMLQEAMDAFTRVPKPDVFMWTSMISAYAKHGKPDEAIQLYHEMRRSGVKADAHVFVAALQACALAADLESGRKLHCDVVQSAMSTNLFVGNCLVDMYAKCGELKDARHVFDSMASKDVVTWTVLITGYSQQGLGHEAIAVYGQMEQEGLTLANHVTFACLLNACASSGALQKGRQLHSQIIERGLMENVQVVNCLLDMYSKCGELEDARQVFDGMSTKDVVTWTTLIAGYAEQGLGQEVLLLYGRMEQEGLILANHVTYGCLLKACASTGALREGRQLHSQIVKRGLLDNVVLGTCLVDMYARCGELEEARQVFDSVNTKDVVTWNVLIAGYTQQGLGHEALALYGRMEQEGILADGVTFACLLKACASSGALQKGRQLHSLIVKKGLLKNAVLGTCLVDMYAKYGELEDARQVFDCMDRKDVVTWTALISGYGSCDEGHKALACFEEMLVAGIQPDGATFTSLLAACSHEGLVDEGRSLFDSMADQHGIKPTPEHYNCMVDLLGRAGRLGEAERMLSSCEAIESDCNIVGLTTLLSASKSYGDIERAICCFERIVKVDPQNASAHVLMANAYADAGRWMDVDRIETQRKVSGANKKPAVTTIEVNRQVHRFLVGEKREDIALKLESTNARVKQEGGHLPHTKLVLKPLSEQEKEDALCGHAEKLALAFGLLNTPSGTPLVVTKNLRMCSDCHSSTEIMSRLEQRDIVVRDGYRVHRFAAGSCSCKGRP